jgi:hypothetical protein
MMKIDGHDNAVVGVSFTWRNNSQVQVLVYDAEIIRENLVQQGMTHEEAREYIEYNIEGAYVGDDTPIVVWPDDEWMDA